MTHKQHIPICPKCGYDQSGEIATWESVCPLNGRCPECGLEFGWADVLDPSRVELAWYVEHAKTPWQMVRRTIPTLWYLLFPNRYWRRLGMEAPRSVKRYVLWVGAMMLGLHLISAGALVATSHVYVLNMNASTQAAIAQSPRFQSQWKQLMYDDSGVDYWWPLIGESILFPAINNSFHYAEVSVIAGGLGMLIFGISTMWFVLFSAFPTTRKRSKLRLAHVVRAMVVCGVLPMLVFEIGRVFDVLLFLGETWTPMNGVEPVLMGIGAAGAVWLLIWIQWFWFSAVWIWWKVKANWFEMFLVMLASFFGIVIAAIIMLILGAIGMVIQMAAPIVGIG